MSNVTHVHVRPAGNSSVAAKCHRGQSGAVGRMGGSAVFGFVRRATERVVQEDLFTLGCEADRASGLGYREKEERGLVGTAERPAGGERSEGS